MSKFNFGDFTNNVKTSLVKYSPEILMGIGIAGMLTTTVLAVKATPKALKLIEEKKKETQTDKLTPVETVKTTWKCYIPAATTAVASTACLIGSSRVSSKRNAVLATAYKIAETAHKEYRDKVVETIGEKKETEVRDKIAKDHVEKNPVNNCEVFITDVGNTLCYDTLSGRYFKTDINKIKKVENILNLRLRNENYVSLNDFYNEVGLDRIRLGDELGWNIDDGYLELQFSSQLTDNDEPCLVIMYSVAPERDYWKLG